MIQVAGFASKARPEQLRIRFPVMGVMLEVYTAADGDPSKAKI